MHRAHQVVVAGNVDGMHWSVWDDRSDDPATKAADMTTSVWYVLVIIKCVLDDRHLLRGAVGNDLSDREYVGATRAASLLDSL